VVESTALEMRRTGNRTVGSNPTLSANLKPLIALDLMMPVRVGGSAPFLGRWSTAEVGHNLIKSGSRPPILWRRI
jgi:hypothetical protein